MSRDRLMVGSTASGGPIRWCRLPGGQFHTSSSWNRVLLMTWFESCLSDNEGDLPARARLGQRPLHPGPHGVQGIGDVGQAVGLSGFARRGDEAVEVTGVKGRQAHQ